MSSIRAALLTLLLAAGCSTPQEPAAPAAPAPAPAATEAEPAPAVETHSDDVTPTEKKDKTLLFFINPSGQPCQMQDMILADMGHTLTDKVDLQPVSIADPAMRPLLSDYGVRALPQLIVVNEHGEELHRFTPGIHESADILAALE